MEFSFLAAPFSIRCCFFAPLCSLNGCQAALTLVCRSGDCFAYHPHLNPLPSRERKFWLAMMDALFLMDEFCIPWEEKEYD